MSAENTARRERAKRLIRELQSRTTENGCTEAEAMEAARKIGELLEANDLDITEIGVREDTAQCRKEHVYAADPYTGVLISGIKHFCNLVAYVETGAPGHAAKYVLFGVPHDLEMGMYLYEVCAEAMEHDWAKYMDRHGYSMKKRASFRQGFASRVYDRLMEMKRERDARNASQSRELVVLKDQLVKQEFGKLGIRLGRAARQRVADHGAYMQGQAAGAKVNLGRPLGGGFGGDRIR